MKKHCGPKWLDNVSTGVNDEGYHPRDREVIVTTTAARTATTEAATKRVTGDMAAGIAKLSDEDKLLASNIQNLTGTSDALLWAAAYWTLRAEGQDTPAGAAVLLGMAKAYHRKWLSDREGWWTR